MSDGIQVNGFWGRVISGLGVIGLVAALGAGVRMEVLASDFKNHKEAPAHDGMVSEVRRLSDAIIRQEAANEKAERTSKQVEQIERKIDALLRSRNIDPNTVP